MFTKVLKKILNKKKKKISLTKDRYGHDRKYLINPKKAFKLGWKINYKMNDALEITIRWYLKKENLNYFKAKKYKF